MSLLQRSTTNGPVVGFADTHPLCDRSSAHLVEDGGQPAVNKWLGIPYAQAQRFQRPSAPVPWTEPLLTQEFGSMFPQPGSGLEGIYGGKEGVFNRSFVQQSEDAFTLNVFGNGQSPSDRLPVLFWIYGGSLNNGSGDKFLYDPTEWIRRTELDGKKVLIVTGNYRTNVFGFASSTDLSAADPQGLSGNYGLYDCVAMLEWIQANIRSFGGDPHNVTIFGESAGAFLVSALLVCRKRLFRKAIMQSGAPGTMQTRALETAYPAYASIVETHGITAATPAARVAALRALPWSELLAAHNAAHAFGGVGLTIETGPNAVWREKIEETLAKGEWDPWIEAVITGTNEDEGSMFALLYKPMLTYEGFAAYISRFSAEIQAEYNARYPSTSPLFVAAADLASPDLDYLASPASIVMSEQLFVRPARRLADAMAESGKCEAVYVYRCREVVDRISLSPYKLGSMHSIEIPLIFNTASLFSPSSHEAATSKQMGDRWIAFACTGIPNVATSSTDEEQEWKKFDPKAPTWFAFDAGGVARNESI